MLSPDNTQFNSTSEPNPENNNFTYQEQLVQILAEQLLDIYKAATEIAQNLIVDPNQKFTENEDNLALFINLCTSYSEAVSQLYQSNIEILPAQTITRLKQYRSEIGGKKYSIISQKAELLLQNYKVYPNQNPDLYLVLNNILNNVRAGEQLITLKLSTL
ncbi:MAG: hypothetical protein OHK0017_05450 [Patescibacteria group bacterium]